MTLSMHLQCRISSHSCRQTEKCDNGFSGVFVDDITGFSGVVGTGVSSIMQLDFLGLLGTT